MANFRIGYQFFAEDEDAEEKGVPQSDVDRIVEKRLNRERKKFEGFETYKEIAELVKSEGGLEGESPEDILAAVKEFYSKDKSDKKGDDKPKSELSDRQLIALAKVDAKDFVEKSTPEDIEDEYNKLTAKGKRRTDAEDARFEIISEKVKKIRATEWGKKNIKDFEEKYPKVSIDDLRKDEEFSTFLESFNGTLIQAYELFSKISGRKKTSPPSTGSVKDKGGKSDEYLSRAEVEAMSSEERHKNYDLIKNSMSRW